MKYSLIFLFLFLLSFNTVAKEHKKTTNHNQISSKQIKQVKHLKQVKKPTTKTSIVKHKTQSHKMAGVASWYGYESGPRTASGELFNPKKLTAAHRSLPFGTKVKVTNLKNNKSVIVVINDRGPYVRNRIIDLSKYAAKAINMSGAEKVTLTIVS